MGVDTPLVFTVGAALDLASNFAFLFLTGGPPVFVCVIV